MFGAAKESISNAKDAITTAAKDVVEKGKNITSSMPTYSSEFDIMEKIVFVILVVICFVILFSIGSSILGAVLQPNNPYVIDGLLTASNSKVFPNSPSNDGVIIQRSNNELTGIEFSWSVWLNVTNLTGTKDYLHVFSKGDNSTLEPIDSRGISSPNNAPGLYLSASTNQLLVVMNTFENIEEKIEVGNIPLLKWIHVLIRLEGQYLDVYVNGILAKRKELSSVPKQNNGGVYVASNGGFNGFISNLRYYNKALSPGDIVSIVNQGPNLKLSSSEQKSLTNTYPNYLALDWYFQSALAGEDAAQS
jgi:hypothetical protein